LPATPKKTPQPKKSFNLPLPANALTILILVSACFLLGGGVYDLINTPGFVTYNSYTSQTTFIADYSDQTLTESFMCMILILLGFVGLQTIYKASQSEMERSKMNLRLGIGAVCFVFSVALLYYFSYAKS